MKKTNSLYERFLNRPIAALMIFCGVLFLGTMSATRLPVELLPDLEYPRLIVYTAAPGLSAVEVERRVVTVQESLFAGLPQLRSLESVADDGYGLLSLTFTRIRDLDTAVLTLREKLASFSVVTPIQEPTVLHHDPNARPVAIISVSARGQSLPSLTALAEDVFVRRLTQLDGVGRVTVIGGATEYQVVRIDSTGLSESNVPPSLIEQALSTATVRVGTIREGRNTYSLRIVEGTESRLTELPVPGTGYRVGDLAEISSTIEYEGIVSTDGWRGLALVVEKQYGANTVQVVDRVQTVLPELAESVSANVSLTMSFQEADFIRDAMDSVVSAIGIGGLLTLVVLILMLGSLRQGIALGLSIPFSVAATMLLFYLQELTLNIMSLGGLALGIGMMVDNGIVVSEAVHRQLCLDSDRVRAVSTGVREVASPITASTLTTVAVFVPIIFLTGPAALLFRDLALAVSYSLVLSLVVSLTLLPVLLGRMGGYGRFGRTVGSVWDAALRLYRPVLHGFNRAGAAVLLATVVLMGLAGWGAVRLPRELLPESGQQRLEIDVVATEGTATDRLYEQMQRVADELPEGFVETVMVTAGLVRDDRVGLTLPSTGQGTIRVLLAPGVGVARARDLAADAMSRIAQELALTVTVRSEANPLEEVLSSGSTGVVVRIAGPSSPAFDETARAAVSLLSGGVGVDPARLTGLSTRSAFLITPDESVLLSEGLSSSAVIAAAEGCFAVLRVTHLNDVVLVERRSAESLDATLATPVRIRGRIYTLGDLVDIEVELAPARILRAGQRRVVDLEFDIIAGERERFVSRLFPALTTLAERLPSGYSIGLSGEEAEARESFQGLGWAFLVALALVYMIMAAQFESLHLPLVIILSVPMALTGVVGLFMLTGESVNIMSAIGAVVALGIVINDAIILTTAMREARSGSGEATLRDAGDHPAYLAAERRFRPIIVTTVTTIAGMLPLALAGEAASRLRAPLALAVIGGLAAATILTLLVLPVVLSRVHRRLPHPPKSDA